MTSAPHETLRRRIDERSAVVGIIGLGYVGLPLALAFVENGLPRARLRRRRCQDRRARQGRKLHQAPRRRPARDRRRESAASRPPRDFSRLGEPDAILICVPTPLTPQREPDMTYVVRTAREIGAAAAPGPARRARVDDLSRHHRRAGAGHPRERSGCKCGRDFFLAFSPEREDPGAPDFTTTTIPKVVGGVDARLGRSRRGALRRGGRRVPCASRRRAPPRPPS